MNNTLLKPGQSIRPIIEESETKQLLEKIYGLKCVFIRRLEGYDDRNYHVKVKLIKNDHIDDIQEGGYVLKILNSLDSEKTSVIEAQDQILLDLCKKGITCPEPVPTKNGGFYSLEKLPSGIHIVRLLKYISGTILCKIPVPNYIFYEVGEFVAKLDKELAHCQHEAYTWHKTLWMLDSVAELKQFLYAIQDSHKYLILSRIIDVFTNTVLKNKYDLERGVIHGDFNEQNILIEKVNNKWKLKAILDFGDAQFSCYLFELAITMAYMLLLERNIEIGGIVIAGYQSVRKIPVKEFKLLKLCVEARLCQSLVLGAYSSLQDPGNNYILTTAKSGWQVLSQLYSMSNEEVLKIWTTVASKYCDDLEFKNYIKNQ